MLLKSIHNNIEYFFFQKCSCSILLLLLNYYNNKCNFIFEEVKNKLVSLLTNPVSYSFVNKILLYLNKSDKNNLKLFIWDIYKKEGLIKTLYETHNARIYKQNL